MTAQKNRIKYGMITDSRFSRISRGTLCVRTPEGFFAFSGNEEFTCEEYITVSHWKLERKLKEGSPLHRRVKQLPFLLKAEYWPGDMKRAFKVKLLTKKEFIARLVMRKLKK